MLIIDCINKNASDIATCLLIPGEGAEPGGGWSDTPAATCNDFDRKAMIKCLTDSADTCCFVLGINGCQLLMNGEPVTIFNND